MCWSSKRKFFFFLDRIAIYTVVCTSHHNSTISIAVGFLPWRTHTASEINNDTLRYRRSRYSLYMCTTTTLLVYQLGSKYSHSIVPTIPKRTCNAHFFTQFVTTREPPSPNGWNCPVHVLSFQKTAFGFGVLWIVRSSVFAKETARDDPSSSPLLKLALQKDFLSASRDGTREMTALLSSPLLSSPSLSGGKTRGKASHFSFLFEKVDIIHT